MVHLKRLRLNQNKTQEQIAKILGIGISTYSQYENSERDIPLDKAIKIAEVFGVDINDIFLATRFTVSK